MARPLPPRSARQDVITLLALCALVFFVGLTTHGLTNWQEAMRALVGRTMGLGADNLPGGPAEWLVPTINGEPYLAKPPMIYWCQLALAKARGLFGGDGVPTVFDLRLTVALAATLGVIATYVVTRRLFRPPAFLWRLDPADALARDAFSQHAAWWASLFLATGILYVRSGRTGELDILLAPFTVIAIGAIHAAWMSHVEHKRMHLGAIALAVFSTVGAALTKGPPGVATILLAGYGGIMLAIASERPASGRAVALGVLVGGLGLSVPALAHVRDTEDGIGAVLLCIAGAAAGAALAPLARGKEAREVFVAFSRTHPVGVALLALGSVYGWLWLVARRIGREAVGRAASFEADSNLILFDPDSIVSNLEAAAYGVGAGSVFAIIGVVWLLTKRPRLGPGLFVVIAWVAFGLIAFSVLGKGVPRYMTPVWPGIAILGGIFFTTALSEFPHTRGVPRLGLAMLLSVVLLGIGQGVWYGVSREQLYGHRHPRAMLEELARVTPVAPIVLDFWTPALDFYAGTHIQPYEDVGPWEKLAGVHPKPLAALREELATSGATRLMLVREIPHRSTPVESPLERLRLAGFRAEPIELASRFVIDNNRTPVIVVRVSAPD